MRLIDADALEEEIDRVRPSANYEIAWVLGIIHNAPTIEPESKTGHWAQIISIPGDAFGRYFCSECGKEGNPLWYICPNCGADMRGEQE